MKLIPEKTIEAWTVSALLDHLSQDLWLRSPSKGEDQRVWDPVLGKIFLLELKAPACESGNPPPPNAGTPTASTKRRDPHRLRKTQGESS